MKTVTPGRSSGATGPRRSTRLLLREFWRHARGSRWLLGITVAAMLLDGLLQAGLINYLKVVIDRVQAAPGDFVQESLPGFAALGLGAAALFFPAAYAGHVATSVLSSRLVTTFRLALYRHLQKLSLSFYQEHRAGEIAARLTSDVDNGVQILVGLSQNLCWASTVLITALVSMLLLSWKLTVVFAALNALYYLTWRQFGRRIGERARDVRDQAGEVAAFATEDVAAVMVMKSFAREDRFLDRFSHAQGRLYKAQVEAARLNHAFGDILQVLGKFLAPVAILGIGAWLVDRDGLSLGALVAFWSYWALVQTPLMTVYGAGPALASCRASLDRIQDFFERDPTPADRPGARPFQSRAGGIEFQHVHFAYPGRPDWPVVRDLNFVVPPRSSLGICGPSGAGKSTLVSLALRFFDPASGAILFDGVDLRDMTQESLRRNTGVVLQEPLLLSGTIRDNIRLGDETAGDDQIWAALEQAGAAEFVRATAHGLDTRVGERGATLSGGQRQRLCIARVFLRDPALVIFDEATAALDTTTEALIHESMQRLLKGRTAILIAHRLSTIVACDRILMLKQGRVIGLAPHAELLATCPDYAALVANQDLRRERRPLRTP